MTTKFRVDNKGSVPFALVAVLILILAGISAVYISRLNYNYQQTALKQAQIASLSSEIEIFRTDLETKAHILAMASISLTQLDKDDSKINYYFSEYFNDYISNLKASNASPNRNYQLYINDWNASVGLARKTCYDVIPSDATTDLPFDYNLTANKAKALDLTYAGKLAVTNCTPYYTVEGWVNCSIKEPSSNLELHKNLTLYKELDAPYPFLVEKFKLLSANSEGGTSNIARIIKYVLTTFAQYRAFQGYGAIDVLELSTLPGRTSDILTPKDVELATNIAVLLETIALYRNADPQAIEFFNLYFPPKVPERTIQNLIENYATNGVIDPADLVALYIALDKEQINAVTIFAQSIYAMIDQYVVKYLEYFDIFENLNITRNFTKRIFKWLGTELSEDKPLVIEAGTLNLTQAVYRNETNDTCMQITELATLNYTGAWYQQDYGWICYGSEGDSVLYSSIDLSLEDSGYDVYPPPNSTLNTSKFFVKAHNSSYLKFEHKLELLDNNSQAKVIIRNSPSEPWHILKTYNSTTTQRELESITIPQSSLNKTIDVGWQLDSNNSSSTWLVKNITTEEVFEGAIVSDTTPPTEHGVDNYTCNLVDSLYTLVNLFIPLDFLQSLYNETKRIIKWLLQSLAQHVASVIVKLLFGDGNYPYPTINPKDKISLIEDTRYTLKEWIEEGVAKLKSNITSSTQFIIKIARDFITEVIGYIVGGIKDALNSILSSAIGWVEDQISQIVDIIKNAVNFCAGGIFWVFGGASYNTVEDYVSNASENFWNELKAKIKGAFSVFLDVVGGVFENITSSAFESLTMLLTPVAEMFRATIVDFLDELGALLNATITWIFTGGELTNTKFLLPMNYQNDFEFWSNDYKVALDNKSIKHERFIVDQTPDYLELESQQTIEAVDLSSWWQYYDTIYPRPSEYKLWVSIGTPQGLHHTDPKLISKTPFEVTWEIGIYGKLQFSARSETRVLLYNGSHEYVSINDSFELNISLPITIYSGWELESVNYKATNIFLTDIARSIFKIWDCAKTAIKLGFDILTKLGELIKNIISPLINFAFWIVDTIYKLFQLAIDWLRGFISDILKSIILPVVDQLKGLGAEKLEFSVFGFNFIIYIDPDSNASYNFYLNPKIDELFSILMNGSIFGIPFKLRLDAIECDSIYDIILTSGLNISGFTSKFVLDPLMTARCHFVETQLLCTNSQGNGLGFDLYFPEFEVTNTISVSVPVTPAPIPIPPLPIQASIEVGTELTYEAPVIDHVVINEFELSSSANELWLELCNPTYEDVSLNGWSISTLTGEKVTYIISSKTIPGAIPSANGYLVIPLPENFRSKSGLSGLVLRNDKGELIDRTPLCMDNYCNGSTWQRAYDCALTWIFHPSSKNGGNPNISSPAEPYLDFKALILSAIKDCFLETKYELSSEYKEELEYVLKFAKTFLRKFKERILEIIREVVVELVFYVDLIIEVIGTGVGGGLKLAFVMEGTAIAELLDWLCKAVVSYVKRLLNPNSCQTFPLPSSELPEHLFLQLEIYGKAEVLPEVLSELLPSPEAELKISFVIKVNIPTFTSFMGPDLGDWRVEFGIKVAYEHGISFVGLGKNRDLEVWLIKGAVYEISN